MVRGATDVWRYHLSTVPTTPLSRRAVSVSTHSVNNSPSTAPLESGPEQVCLCLQFHAIWVPYLNLLLYWTKSTILILCLGYMYLSTIYCTSCRTPDNNYFKSFLSTSVSCSLPLSSLPPFSLLILPDRQSTEEEEGGGGRGRD